MKGRRADGGITTRTAEEKHGSEKGRGRKDSGTAISVRREGSSDSKSFSQNPIWSQGHYNKFLFKGKKL